MTNQRFAVRTGRAALALALGATLSIAGGCSRGDDSNAYAPPPPPEVIVATPVERDVVSYLTYTGVVEASETVDLRARVQGFLDEVKFDPGQRVKKDEVLFVIDKREYEAAVEQSRAEVEAQQASFEGAANDAKLARELADERAGPEIDAVIKAARRDALAASVKLAQAMLVEKELELDYCTITAPIDGRVTANLVDPGNLVGRGEPTLLGSIIQSTPCYVSVDVSESDVLDIRRELEAAGTLADHEPGQIAPGEWRPCELALAGEDEFRFKGRVEYVAPQIDRESGTLRVRTMYENKDERLVAGMFARVRFPMKSRRAMLVPDAALLSDQQGRYAMVVNAQDQVEVRRVKVGALDGSMRVVEEGLTPGDRVVVLGVLKARPGAKVTPKTQEPAAQGG